MYCCSEVGAVRNLYPIPISMQQLRNNKIVLLISYKRLSYPYIIYYKYTILRGSMHAFNCNIYIYIFRCRSLYKYIIL